MVLFTDDANRFWLEQSLDKGEMPKRGISPEPFPSCYQFEWETVEMPPGFFRPMLKITYCWPS